MDELVVQVGSLISDRFRVLGKLGEGGMGVVYRVEHVTTGAHHALKLLNGEVARNEKIRERFVREAQVSARVASEHLVSVSDAGTDASGALFLVMELLDGATLEDVITARAPVAPGVTLAIMEQVCHALGAAHAGGVFHRDIKPANVFLTRRKGVTVDVIVKLLDFGIAKMVSAGEPQKSTIQAGSTAWAPPEQWNPQVAPTPSIDVWPLGLMAFTMLTGFSYWESENETTRPRSPGVLSEVLAAPIVFPTARLNAVGGAADLLPSGFDVWFASCVERDPTMRCAGPLEALQGLRAVLGTPSAIPLDLLPDSAKAGRVEGSQARGQPMSATHMALAAEAAAAKAAAPAPFATSAGNPSAVRAVVPGPSAEGMRGNRRGVLAACAAIPLCLLVAARLWSPSGTAPTKTVAAAPSANDASASVAPPPEPSTVAREPWRRANVLEAVKARGVLRVAVENEAPPLNMGQGGAAAFEEGARSWGGFDHDVVVAVARELATEMGLSSLPVEVHAAELDALPALLASDRADIVMGGQIARKSHELSWSDPYLDFGLCLVGHLGSDVRSVADLGPGRTVAIYKGDRKAEQFVREKFGSVVLVEAEGTGWLAPLVEGRWDAAVYDFPFAVEEISEKAFSSLRIVEMNLTESQYVIGMPAGNTDLVRAINAALGRAFGRSREKTNYAELVRKYFGASGRIAEDQLPANQRIHIVKAGETLKSIASRELGDEKRVDELWNANKARFGSRLLVSRGDKLLLPPERR